MIQPSPSSRPKRGLKLSELSVPRQVLVRLCQSIDYGEITDLLIRENEPVFSPATTVVVSIKLDGDSGSRPNCELEDFALRDEVCRLFQQIDHIRNGLITSVEIRAGIPRRVVIQRCIQESPQ